MNDNTPVDLGTGVVCASFAGSGAWLSIGTPHPRHGFVELNALPPFDETQRGDPAATRAYRQLMLSGAHAFLRIEVGGSTVDGHVFPIPDDPQRPAWMGRVGRVLVHAQADAAEEGAVHQHWSLELDDPAAVPPSVRLGTWGRLDRPALAEISELDPSRPTRAETRLATLGRQVVFEASELPAVASVDVSGVDAAWQVDQTGRAVLEVPWAAGTTRVTFDIVVALVAADRAPPRSASTSSARRDSAESPKPGLERITRRALAYVRGCTALRTAPDERVILTDHRLLPLSWTRDAYFQTLLLLVSDGPGDRDRVADHLRWLWRRNERPDGRWVRSHHADGRRKDVAFQADQQLYPIIELADFWRTTGDLPRGVDWATLLPEAWQAALGELDSTLGLVATLENAADDPAAAPYIAGSQVVLWYAARRLAELAGHEALNLDLAALLDLAASVRAGFDRHLAVDGRWAYATDQAGRLVEYHDANDLPIALAPAWGFCARDDPGWLATMRFAFSPTNLGFWQGPMSGLGSAHTPGAWTLGDIQAWLFAALTADAGAASNALARLNAVATPDGMLPEAYTLGADGRLVRVRHWFAWPGAAFGAFTALARQGALLDRLAVA